MQVKNFDEFSKFADEIILNMNNVKNNITIVAYYEDAVEILRELIKTDKVDIYSIDIHDYYWDNYDNEYYITVSKSEDGYILYCEKAYNVKKDIYLYSETNILYIASDCNSRILQRINSDVAYEVRFCDDDEEDDFDKMVKTMMNVEEIKMDEDMKGFTISHSDDYGYSSFSFHSTDESLVRDMLKNYKKF